MTPAEMPTELLVIGSGAIGIEFASFYADLGAKVTVVEMLDRIVPVEDAEVSAQLAEEPDQAGADDPHRRGRREPDAPTQTASRRRSRPATARSPSSASATVIVAVGIVPNTENIGLEALGVKTDQGPHRHRPDVPHQRPRHLGDRRRHRAALARAQGEPRRRHRRRGDRAGARQQGRPPARDRPEEHPRLHLLPPAGRQRRPDRGQGQGERATRSRSASSRPSATARRSRSARSRASSRPCSTPRPASCSART